MIYSSRMSIEDPYRVRRLRALRARQKSLLDHATPGLPIDGDVPATRKPTVVAGDCMERVLDEILASGDPFFANLREHWDVLFPDFQARPVRGRDGRLVLQVRSAAQLFTLRPKLPSLKRRLAVLPGAPKRLVVNLEIRACPA